MLISMVRSPLLICNNNNRQTAPFASQVASTELVPQCVPLDEDVRVSAVSTLNPATRSSFRPIIAAPKYSLTATFH